MYSEKSHDALALFFFLDNLLETESVMRILLQNEEAIQRFANQQGQLGYRFALIESVDQSHSIIRKHCIQASSRELESPYLDKILFPPEDTDPVLRYAAGFKWYFYRPLELWIPHDDEIRREIEYHLRLIQEEGSEWISLISRFHGTMPDYPRFIIILWKHLLSFPDSSVSLDPARHLPSHLRDRHLKPQQDIWEWSGGHMGSYADYLSNPSLLDSLLRDTS